MYSYKGESMIPFEEDYQTIKEDPNLMWLKYEEKLLGIIHNTAITKHVEVELILNECYLYFLDYCKKYDPYYNNQFIPFIKYIHRIMKIRAMKECYKITKVKNKETLYEIVPEQHNQNLVDPTNCIDQLIKSYEIQELISALPKNYQIIIECKLKGYDQHQISKTLNCTQSWISHMTRDMKNYNKNTNNARMNTTRTILKKLHKILKED